MFGYSVSEWCATGPFLDSFVDEDDQQHFMGRTIKGVSPHWHPRFHFVSEHDEKTARPSVLKPTWHRFLGMTMQSPTILFERSQTSELRARVELPVYGSVVQETKILGYPRLRPI